METINDRQRRLVAAQAKYDQLIEARRVLGTGIKNFERWLSMRLAAENQTVVQLMHEEATK